MIKFFKSNLVNTWEKDYPHSEVFAQRIESLLSLVDQTNISSVMDLGCGYQYALNLLKEGVEYYPVDLHKYSDSVIVKDFNKKEFLPIHVDLILCSGIFEYI